MLRKIVLSASFIAAAGTGAWADDAETKAKAEAFAKSDIAQWAADPAIIAAVEAANAEHAALSTRAKSMHSMPSGKPKSVPRHIR